MVNISDKVQCVNICEGVDLYVLKTGHKGMVQLKLIRPGGEIHTIQNRELARAYAAMLDQGSCHRSREDWANYTDDLGANIGFDFDEFRQVAIARCLSEDVAKITHAMVEQSLNPLIPLDHWSLVKSRLMGSLQQLEDDTKTQALIKLLQKFFPHNHPHYATSVEESMELIEAIQQNEIASYHKRVGNSLPLTLFAVGDVDVGTLSESLAKEISNKHMSAIDKPVVDEHFLGGFDSKYHVEIKDKSSVDCFLAQHVKIHRSHPDYLSLMFGIHALGGNFSARLMRTVRDVEGLTYGVYSRLVGVNDGLQGYWYIHGTFAPHLIDKGYESVMKQVDEWYQKGISSEECGHRKEGIIGKYLVGLSSVRGLMDVLARDVVQGLGVEYIDQYPELIRSINAENVNRCIKQYIDPSKLVQFSSGTLKGSPLEL